MQDFIRTLKRGDTVQVTFTDSVAVSVIPAS
jgi:TusA-related sulfurtransferase